MKKHKLAALLLAAALTLTACGGGQAGDTSSAAASGSVSASAFSGGSQVQAPVDVPFQLAVYPDYSLHPALGENRANLTLAPLLYEPLFQLDGAFRPIPVLCESYTASEDKLVWTFTLRQNVTFSDGSPLTGEAVAGALNAARGPGSRFAARLAGVASVEAEEGAVTVTLSRPNGDLPALLDIPIAQGLGDRPCGTGPYLLEGEEDSPKLTARAGWWQRETKTLPARELLLTAVEGSEGLISAFDAGEAGLVDADLMGTNALGYSGSYETWDYGTTDLLYIGFNARDGLCRDPAVRRALARGIDREAVTQSDYARHAVPSTLPIHPYSPLYSQELAGALSYAPETMAAGLEEVHALGRPLKLAVNSENTAKAAAAQRIAYQLEAAGMEVEVERLPFDAFRAALGAGGFDLYLGEVVLTADFELSALLSPAGTLNYGGWTDDGTAEALMAALRAAEGDGRKTAAGALCAYLNEQVPFAPVCFKNGSVLTQWGRLSGLAPVRENAFYGLENWTIQ